MRGGLSFHAPKSRVNVRIVRLKPVAGRPAQHARSGACSPAFCDVMLAVKEVGGVARIKRKWLEPGKGPEDCARPLPTIAQQVGRTEGTGAGGIRPHGDPIPAPEVQVPEELVLRVVSPRVKAVQTVPGALVRAVELGSRGTR